MKKLKLFAFGSALALALAFAGCKTEVSPSTPNEPEAPTFTGTAYTALSAGTAGTAGPSGTYVLFGDWPQTIKAADVTVDENESVTMGANTYYKGSDNAWYANLSDKYYKVEPIKWRVLTDNYNGKKLLLAENILAAHRYAASSNNYKNSEIREWLNGTFLGAAFTASVRNQIATTTVDNSARSTNPDANATQWNSGENEYACENTSDKIFLLSEQEVTKEAYGFAAYNLSGVGNSRIRMTTDYAKANGAWQTSTAGYGGWWWLRSPYCDYSDYARDVYIIGYADCYSNVSSDDAGVVPALCIEN